MISYTIIATNTGNVTLAGVDRHRQASLTGRRARRSPAPRWRPARTIDLHRPPTPSPRPTSTRARYVNTACVDDGQRRGRPRPATTRPSPADDNPALIDRQGADSDATYDAVGDMITYTIVATNTGNVTLAAVTVTDTLATLGDCARPVNGCLARARRDDDLHGHAHGHPGRHRRGQRTSTPPVSTTVPTVPPRPATTRPPPADDNPACRSSRATTTPPTTGR